ncbi:TPA: hypothetical protein TZM60_001750 [Streptococcus suis]|uniref:Uncharacterized protein n=2 Tax=Streptococcus suis TaxID=1307 RepID=A0A116RUW2_STRSU|nr:hypothetical protein [Streptococcus suis]MBY5023946.1 hypothetical protein [Streptococcus suis]MDW8597092.1 hypothetical protein [Streptococcus suis]MDW8607295.1 hypothetical protein [Streptococcus suis]MDW8617043.1 hypothetical protein [Streptococcus suis]NQM00762.1 hypothetical protein [Streptococcus suis]
MASKQLEALLERANKSDEELDYITDYLASLNNEAIETTLAGKFEAVSRFIWEIQDYLQEKLKEKTQNEQETDL